MLRYLLLVTCALWLLFAAAEAALVHGQFYCEANPGKCTFESLVLGPGDSAKAPNDCARISCHSDDGWLTIETCGSVAPPLNCEWSDYVNEDAIYPACCERNIVCVESNPSNQTLAKARAYQEQVHNMLGKSVAQLAGDADGKQSG